MAEPIKRGDLVMVVRHCCATKPLGLIGRVSIVTAGDGFCRGCGTDHRGVTAALIEGDNSFSYRVSWLKKLDPDAVREYDRLHERIPA